MLAAIGFIKKKALANGDCLLLSASAGFEITVAQAKQPSNETTRTMRTMREGAVGSLTGDHELAGVTARVLRKSERLPEERAAAFDVMRPWLVTGYWKDDGGNEALAASFGLGADFRAFPALPPDAAALSFDAGAPFPCLDVGPCIGAFRASLFGRPSLATVAGRLRSEPTAGRL